MSVSCMNIYLHSISLSIDQARTFLFYILAVCRFIICFKLHNHLQPSSHNSLSLSLSQCVCGGGGRTLSCTLNANSLHFILFPQLTLPLYLLDIIYLFVLLALVYLRSYLSAFHPISLSSLSVSLSPYALVSSCPLRTYLSPPGR